MKLTSLLGNQLKYRLGSQRGETKGRGYNGTTRNFTSHDKMKSETSLIRSYFRKPWELLVLLQLLALYILFTAWFECFCY